MAGAQCQTVREARLRNNIMRSKPSCSRYGVARLRRKRTIWIFWKVTEVTVIRGDRRERQQWEEKDRWNVSIFTETCRKVKRIKRGSFPFEKYHSLCPPRLPALAELQNVVRNSRVNLDSLELCNVAICLRNTWQAWKITVKSVRSDSEVGAQGWASGIYEIASKRLHSSGSEAL